MRSSLIVLVSVQCLQSTAVRASACLNLSPTLLNSFTHKEVIWCYGSHKSLEMSSSSSELLLNSVEASLPSDPHSAVLPVRLNPKVHPSILNMLASCALLSSQVFAIRQQAKEFIMDRGLHSSGGVLFWHSCLVQYILEEKKKNQGRILFKFAVCTWGHSRLILKHL